MKIECIEPCTVAVAVSRRISTAAESIGAAGNAQ